MEAQKYMTYRRNDCAVFLRTAERFGGLSNMAGGYPLLVNRVRILTSEALYQACRFPHSPEVQKLIIGQVSPMTAKMKSKPFRNDSRPDWDDVRLDIMRWCLRVKLAQHWDKFGELLLSTENCPIVEESYRDQFWGAKPIDAETLIGENILGRLLMELREQLKNSSESTLRTVEPLSIPQFLLLNKPIGLIDSPKSSSSLVFTSTRSQLITSEQLTLDATTTGSVNNSLSTKLDQNLSPTLPANQQMQQLQLW